MLNNMEHENETQYTIKNFLPLIIIYSVIILFTGAKQFFYGFDIHNTMYDFMGIYFIIFSLFKIINLKGFAEAYSSYDIIAKRFTTYAYMYPFIELILGIFYLIRFQLFVTNVATLLLMITSSIGVAYELAQKKEIMCACLGVVFKIPMTYVTLSEDLIMGIMAFLMLIYSYF